MINPIISSGSNALQALEQLWASRQPNAGGNGAGVFSTGQSLPAGANATGSGQAPSTPANQFDAATLNFLTSLQDAGSSAAEQLSSSGYLSNTGQGVVQQGLGDLTSIVQKLEQALTRASGGKTTSSATPASLASAVTASLTNLASTASAAAAALSSGTPTATAAALSQLEATLQSLGIGGHHHHHHHWGDAQSASDASGSSGSASGGNSGTGTASVGATTTPAATGGATS